MEQQQGVGGGDYGLQEPAAEISQSETVRRTSLTKPALDDSYLELSSYHLMSPAQVAKQFGTKLNERERYRESFGLSTSLVNEKHMRGEKNAVTPPKRVPEWIKFLLKFLDTFMLLLVAAAVLCLIIYAIDPIHDPTNMYIGVLLFVVVFINSSLAYLQERQSDKVMETFQKLMAKTCIVVRDGKEKEISADDLVTGDLVLLRAGDKTPGDIRLIEVNNLQSDNSAMTGESEPVRNTVDATSDVAVQSANFCWSGSFIVDGNAVGICVNVGDATMIGKVSRLASATIQPKSILEKEILRFVRICSIGSFILAIALVALGLGRKFATIGVIIAAASILIANIPQGLPPAVTTVLAITAKALAKRNMLVKKLDIVETLGSASVIATDKTGTLTENRMTSCHTWSSRTALETLSESQALETMSMRHLARVLILCNRLSVDRNVKTLEGIEFAADASEIGLFKRSFLFDEYHMIRESYPKRSEIPFNSVNKWQLSVHVVPAKEHIYFQHAPKILSDLYLVAMKGAPEIICNLCENYYNQNGVAVKLTEDARSFIVKQITSFASDGERVLGFADAYVTKQEVMEIEAMRSLPSSVAAKLNFAGLNTLLDPPKKGVREAVISCIRAGIKVIMITGDFPVTAEAIAKQVSIFSPASPSVDQAIFLGADTSKFSERDWDNALCKPRLVFARMQPEHKLMVVEQLQRRGEVVAVTGDGVNDSPALKRADVGIAMGIAGTEVAKEAAKIICTDDNFASIVEGIRYGRIIFDNLYKTILLVVTHLVPEAWPFLYVYFFNMPLGLTSLLLLTIDLGTEMFPSIALSYEGPEKDIMTQPPRDLKKDRLITWTSLSHCYLEVGSLETLCCTALYLHILMVRYKIPGSVMVNGSNYFYLGCDDIETSDGRIWTDEQQIHIIRECQSLWYAGIVGCQLGHVVAIRAVRAPFWSLPRNNRLYAGILIAIAIMCFMIYTPGVQTVFLTRPFHPGYWIGVIISAFLTMSYVEFKKLVSRLMSSHAIIPE